MFEVIYISQTCKQAVNFINDLAIKLKQRGIDNVDIDRKTFNSNQTSSLFRRLIYSATILD